MDFSALEGKVDRDDLDRVRRQGLSGAFGPIPRRPVMLRMAPWLVAGVVLVVLVTLAFTLPTPRSASGWALWITVAVVFVLAEVIGTTALLRVLDTTQWRHRTRVVQVAEANGLRVRLVAEPQDVPVPIRSEDGPFPVPPHAPPQAHIEVLTGSVAGYDVVCGQRVPRTGMLTDTSQKSRTELERRAGVAWAAIRRRDATAGQLAWLVPARDDPRAGWPPAVGTWNTRTGYASGVGATHLLTRIQAACPPEVDDLTVAVDDQWIVAGFTRHTPGALRRARPAEVLDALIIAGVAGASPIA